MNVFLRRWHLLFWAFLVPLLSSAQNVVNVYMDTYQNTPGVHQFVSTPNAPSLVQAPQHGTFQWVQAPPFNYTLTYNPQEDFIGTDFMRLWIWNSGSSWSYLDVHITVEPAQVNAVRDFASTNINTPVQINVLDNDFSSNGTLILAHIPLVNGGSASFVPGSNYLTFTPATNYVGLTYLNYVVCDGAGTCDNGTVSISVMSTDPSPTTDTLSIFTKKNQAQAVLVPSSYTLLQGPAHGTYSASGNVPLYTPANNYVGSDLMVFSHGGSQTIVAIKVLNLSTNTFAFDDIQHITSYQQAEFNILENDVFQNTGCLTMTQPDFGTLTHSGYGNVTYTPPAGFSGVARFTYTACPPMNPGFSETATVLIYVSNYQPAATTFNMSTPKRTPLVISYDAPIQDFNFQITNQGDLGQVIYFPGDVDTTIYDREIKGYNLLLYIPNSTIDEGQDEFEVSYCTLNPDGDCAFDMSVKVEIEILNIGQGDEPMCFGDCVWAGDTNFDGVVSMEDLLPLGYNMGEVGSARPNVTFDQWYGQYADNWNNIFAQSSVDLKHLDTDGDSIVSALDTTAISLFYGKTHFLVPAEIPYYPFIVQLQGDLFASPGDLVELDIVMGTASNPAKDVYGFTFNFPYNTFIFEPESVHANFGGNSWLSYNSPVLHMQKNNLNGLLATGYTRTSGLAASGHGEIGKLSFIVSDDLNGFRTDDDMIAVTIGGSTSRAMNANGQMAGLAVEPVTLYIQLKKQDTPLAADQLKAYPNPTGDLLNIHLNGGREFEKIAVYNLMGQQMMAYDMQSNKTQLDVSYLVDGLYIVTAFTRDGAVSQKFEVKHQ